MPSLKPYFTLDPSITFLNHGSFGACPRQVIQAYQKYQRMLEFEPVRFLAREAGPLIKKAKEKLGELIHADPEDLVFITNATFGVNIVSRSLNLQPGDEILSSDHEYGACEYAWQFHGHQTGARYIKQHLSLPVTSSQELVDEFWKGVTPRTRVIYLSHVTSPTALRLPLEAICQRAREAGIITVIDGAHAPGNIPLNLTALGADYYTGNCHKWLMAPKGSAFLYTRRELQPMIKPLVVSWGYHENADGQLDANYVSLLEVNGTRDPAAFISVADTIEFRKSHQWENVQQRCHDDLTKTLEEIRQVSGIPALYPDTWEFYGQMAVAPIPPETDLGALSKWMWEENHIEIPCIQWNGSKGLRISVQGYITRKDLKKLVRALDAFLHNHHS